MHLFNKGLAYSWLFYLLILDKMPIFGIDLYLHGKYPKDVLESWGTYLNGRTTLNRGDHKKPGFWVYYRPNMPEI